ncbi:MAG: Mobile element protein [Candidatus Carbobacillus altaicus]|uniref:Mobile element protein n=1 Tax=Candidatus Carbonibacillus altaicus TaxID=2163959 RepID=A0A2R6XXM3_9BACL|nr:MAG: Mobile element protein [Candidatus Carbobacillus altaicus]
MAHFKQIRIGLIQCLKRIPKRERFPADHLHFSSLYHRIAARRGANRAAVAVAHRILVIVYHPLKEKQTYNELGPQYYEEHRREHVAKQALRKLQSLGYTVTIEVNNQTA